MENKIIRKYFEITGLEKGNKKNFCILENKKNGRGIIFEKGNKKALKFMKSKLNSPIKKIGYFLINFNILQIFLKKIKLDSAVGQLVFLGGQTKIFNFDKKIVISFLRCPGWEKGFIKNKKLQRELSKKGFAPKILKLDKKVPYSIEELLEDKFRVNSKILFKKLLKFYSTQKIKKITYSSYIKRLEKKASFYKLPPPIKKKLERIKNTKKSFYITNVHGDFGKSQLLLKGKKIVFTDWNIRKDLLLTDLFHFFKDSANLFREKEFWELLDLFPKDVKENVRDYFVPIQVNLFLSNFITYNTLIEQINLFISYSKESSQINRLIC